MIDTDEQKRLDALHSYNILETEPETEFDELTHLAASICNAPVAMINLVDEEYQWSKSLFGITNSIRKIRKERSICQYTIQHDTLLEIPNLSKDNRFKDVPYVKNKPHLKYYLGAPLKNPDGYNIGALCVLDYKERHLPEKQRDQLKILARQVMKNFELQKQNQQLAELNKQQVNLMKILSHDLRSPLSGIIGMSDLLEELISSDQEEAHEMVSLLNQSAKQVNQFIDDILNYTIIESKGFSLNVVPAYIHTVVENMKRLYMPSAKLKDIDLTFDVDIENEEVRIDVEKFEQIFGNLISNALKFTQKNGSVYCQVEIKKIDGVRTLVLKVKDTGVGMDEEKADQLFTTLNIGGKKGTSGEKSTGLGLSIIKHFTELHNGNIDIQSTPGEGTTFKISLPIQKKNKSR